MSKKRLSAKSILETHAERFFTRQLFEDAGFQRRIAGRAHGFVRRCSAYHNHFRGYSRADVEYSVAEFLKEYPSTRKLLDAKYVGKKVASAFAFILKRECLPFEE